MGRRLVEPHGGAQGRRREGLDPERFATRETLHLSPLPCWEHLPEEAYRQRVAALVEEIEQEAAAERLRNGGIGVLGREAILARDPPPPSRAVGPLAGSPRARGHSGGPSSFSPGLCAVRGRVPQRGRKASIRGPQRALSGRLLPSGAAVRAWVVAGGSSPRRLAGAR